MQSFAHWFVIGGCLITLLECCKHATGCELGIFPWQGWRNVPEYKLVWIMPVASDELWMVGIRACVEVLCDVILCYCDVTVTRWFNSWKLFMAIWLWNAIRVRYALSMLLLCLPLVLDILFVYFIRSHVVRLIAWFGLHLIMLIGWVWWLLSFSS